MTYEEKLKILAYASRYGPLGALEQLGSIDYSQYAQAQYYQQQAQARGDFYSGLADCYRYYYSDTERHVDCDKLKEKELILDGVECAVCHVFSFFDQRGAILFPYKCDECDISWFKRFCKWMRNSQKASKKGFLTRIIKLMEKNSGK